LGIDACTIKLGNALAQGLPALLMPSHVISAPAFGTLGANPGHNSSLFVRGVRHSEDLYTELSLSLVQPNGRVVLLVPDNMLFAAGARIETRRLVLEQSRIVAIISLARGLLLPYTGVKTSILVLDRSAYNNDRDVFMMHVDESALKQPSDSRVVSAARAADAFDDWTSSGHVDPAAWTVGVRSIDVANLVPAFYRHTGGETHLQQYLSVPLEQITQFVKRGTSLKLDDKGDVTVIGPGAIRPMLIDSAGFGRTSKSNISGKPLLVEAGDVVVNNIGMYLGSSAVVDTTIAGGCVSQHAIVIRPDTSKVLPEYLAAALNSKDIAAQMQRKATGTVMASLTIVGLCQVTIPLPDMKTQHRIVKTVIDAREKLLRARAKLTEAEVEFSEAIDHSTLVG